MPTILLIVFITAVSALVGWQSAYAWNVHQAKKQLRKEAKELEARAADSNLATSMSRALQVIEDCAKQLDPPHPEDCQCAYCEIKYGPRPKTGLQYAKNKLRQINAVADKETGEVFHPDYIRALQNNVLTLKRDNAILQAELKKYREVNRASERQAEYIDTKRAKDYPIVYKELA